MLKTALMATTALLATAGASYAQTAPQSPPQSAPVVDANQQGVLVFQPDFFTQYTPNTALDMVERVPGFSLTDGDGSRGFEGAVGNVLINGARPASKNDTGSNVLSRTLASQVERIELIRGGAPGIDMQGFAVVVNVITKSTSSRQWVFSHTGFLFEGGHDLANTALQFTAKDGDQTWGVTLSDGVSMSDANGMGRSIRTDAAGNVIRDEGIFTDQYGGSTAIRGNYSSPFLGGKIDLTGRWGVNDYHSYTRLDAANVLRLNTYEDEGSSGEFGAVYTRPLAEKYTLETRFIHEFGEDEGVSLSNTRLGAVDSPEQRFTSQSNNSETILRALVRHERSPRLTFEGGGEVAYNKLDTEQAYTEGGVPVPLPSASIVVEETRGEVFGRGTFRMRPNLTFEGGVRLEASTISQSGDAEQEKSFFFAKPRLLATWTPMPNNQLRVRFEREVGQLDFGDFAASADFDDENVLGGNVDLSPEQRWISEVTYERRFLSDGILSVGYRHDEITDVIDLLPLQNGGAAVGNIGNGTLDQLTVNFILPMDGVGFSGGKFSFKNTWNHTEVIDPTSGRVRPISNVRASQAVVAVSQDITSWKFNWSIAWIPDLGVANYNPDQTSGFRGSNYFELAAEYKPTSTLTLSAQVNLWDDFQTFRTVYANRTAARPIDFTENRYIDPRTFWRIGLRKTF